MNSEAGFMQDALLVLGNLAWKTFISWSLGPRDHDQTNLKLLSFLFSGLGLVRGTRVRHSLGRPGMAVEMGTGWAGAGLETSVLQCHWGWDRQTQAGLRGDPGPRVGWRGPRWCSSGSLRPIGALRGGGLFPQEPGCSPVQTLGQGPVRSCVGGRSTQAVPSSVVGYSCLGWGLCEPCAGPKTSSLCWGKWKAGVTAFFSWGLAPGPGVNAMASPATGWPTARGRCCFLR